MDGFKGIFQGGECNTELNDMGTNMNNPFKNFMSSLFNNNNSIEGQFLNNNGNFQEINNMMNSFNNAWEQGNVEAQKEILFKQNMFQNLWKNEMLKNNINQENLLKAHSQWTNEFQQQNNNYQNFYMPFNNNFTYGDNSQHLKEQNKIKQEEKKNLEMESVDSLIQTMSQDPDPRFRNSELWDFLLKVKTGEYELKDNQLIVNEDKKLIHDFKNKLNLNQHSDHLNQNNEDLNQDKEDLNQDNEEFHNNMKSYWDELNNYDENDPLLEEKLKKYWEDSLNQYNKTLDEEDYVKHWQKSTDIEELNNKEIDINNYDFKKENEFSHKENPLQYLKDYISVGDIISQVKVIEAHLQKNENDINSWKFLGKLFNEMNEDQKSASCFLKAIQINPNDHKLYHNLGINCNNVLNEILAVHYLEKFFNLKYNKTDVVINEDFLTSNELNDTILLNLMNKLNEKFLNEYNLNKDIELLEPLGVINYITRNYETSKSFFEEAHKSFPNNFNILNRLGAVNAMLGYFDDSIIFYQKSLDLKPNYVRVWTNMGLSFLSKQKYLEALSFFINSLKWNPNSIHIWNYVEIALIHIDKEKYLPLIGDRNVEAFREIVNIYDYNKLPSPENESYLEQSNKYYIDNNIDEWINSFTKED